MAQETHEITIHSGLTTKGNDIAIDTTYDSSTP